MIVVSIVIIVVGWPAIQILAELTSAVRSPNSRCAAGYGRRLALNALLFSPWLVESFAPATRRSPGEAF